MPSKEQIEAAAKVLGDCLARPAAVAYAQAALTAAAEVGEKDETYWQEAAINWERKANEMRERCAQAVWDAGGDNVEFHCAAIRALKDKP